MKIWSSTSDWELVLPPSRPTDFQLNIIKGKLELLPQDAKVAILGSTPEFRDLLWEMNIPNIFVFDKSIDFYQKMSQLRVYNNNEIFVTGDWLDTLCGFHKCFDMVLSDLTAGNIEYKKRKQFYSLIVNSIRENGFFIDKYLTNENGLLTLDEIKDKYTNLLVNLATVNDFSCEAIFCSELQTIARIIDTTKIYQLLNEHFKDNKRIQKFIDLSHYVTPEDCFWYYGNSSVDYIEQLTLECRHTLSDTVYQDRAYIYVWKKLSDNS
jgi:hypothetical protein